MRGDTIPGLIAVAALAVLAAGCSSSSSNISTVKANTTVSRLVVCHGFDCRRQTKLELSGGDAVRSAVKYFETRAGQAIGVRDEPKSDITQSGLIGQMDCIDESTNTRTLLFYLQGRGLLKHHKVMGNVSRGFFADGRYPHSTAVLQENGGTKWAIDSWYEPMGGAPDVMPLAEWQGRGVMGER